MIVDSRCAMTIVNPDTLIRDHDVLRDIGRRFDGKLALDADVIRPGSVRVGAEVRLHQPNAADS